MLHGGLPPGEYCLERYGKPWRVVRVAEVASGLARSEAVPVLDAVGPVGDVGKTSAPVVAESVPRETAAAKMERLLAEGRRLASVVPAPVADDLPAEGPGYEVPPRAFWRAGPDARCRWVRQHWPDLTDDEAVQERLAECRAK